MCFEAPRREGSSKREAGDMGPDRAHRTSEPQEKDRIR